MKRPFKKWLKTANPKLGHKDVRVCWNGWQQKSWAKRKKAFKKKLERGLCI